MDLAVFYAYTRYAIRESRSEAGLLTGFSLAVHPAITLALCYVLDVSAAITNSMVLMAAMSPGLNPYLFVTMYQRGEAAAASLVVMATVLSVFTVSLWLETVALNPNFLVPEHSHCPI